MYMEEGREERVRGGGRGDLVRAVGRAGGFLEVALVSAGERCASDLCCRSDEVAFAPCSTPLLSLCL
jgi:hypothetical protein